MIDMWLFRSGLTHMTYIPGELRAMTAERGYSDGEFPGKSPPCYETSVGVDQSTWWNGARVEIISA